jgi:hypothetical protein
MPNPGGTLTRRLPPARHASMRAVIGIASKIHM